MSSFCTPYISRYNPGQCYMTGHDYLFALEIGVVIIIICGFGLWLLRGKQ